MRFDIDITYTIEREPLGTGGGVRLALDKCADDHVFVFNGDTFIHLNPIAIEHAWQARGGIIIVGKEMDDTGRYGRLEVEGDRVVSFSEKKSSEYGVINTGCYVFSSEILTDCILNHPFSLEHDFLPLQAKQGAVTLFLSNGEFIDIGTPEDYLKAQSFFRSFPTSRP